MDNKEKNGEKPVKYSINSNYITGCRFDNWIRLLWQNKFKIPLKFVPNALYITLMSFIMFWPALLEKLIYGRRIKKTEVTKHPLFILGHWRSGTTYLFNVLAEDSQYGHFDAVTTFTHNNFLLLGKLIRPILAKSMPEKRPMDDIKYTTFVPQEELYAYGSQIPECIIHMSAFPENFAYYRDMAFTKNLSERQLKRFIKAYTGIIQKMTYANGGKRMLLKSPDNTAHVDAILKMYPDAKFIHIYRNPYRVVISTIGLFNTMFPMFSLQGYPEPDLCEDYIIEIYKMVYTQYLEDKKLIPEGNLIEIRYEDFVKEPVKTLEDVYQTLGLDGFDEAKPKFESYIAGLGNYKTNTFNMTPQLKKKINDNLKYFVEYFGYEYEE